jgi:cytochrome c peroxidase
MTRPHRTLLLAGAAVALAACHAREVRPAQLEASPPAWESENPLRPLPAVPLGSPADLDALPFRVTPAKVRLGRWLFFDARLSADGTVSCATCHRPDHAFSEPDPVSTGIRGQKGSRKAPPILNAAWPVRPVFFWDGRAGSLAEQAKGPMANPIEMGSTHVQVVATVSGLSGYRPYFREAFGDDRIDLDRIVEAIAAYEATRLDGNSAYDRFDAGDPDALTAEQRRGRDLFFGKAECVQCHLGPNFSDAQFHNLGIGWRPPPPGRPPLEGFRDTGRYAVTHDTRDVGAFKTPTLRDCSRHAPYMHDGSIPDLRAAVLHYVKGGTPNPWLSERIRPLSLSPAEVDRLVAFLRALDGTGFEDVAPRAFPR